MNKEEILEEIRNIRAEQRNFIESTNCKINELEKKFNDIESSTEDEEEWIPEKGDKYYYLDKDVEAILNVYNYNKIEDKARIRNKVVFKTIEEAHEYFEYYRAKEKAQNEFSKEEWKDDEICKYDFFFENTDLTIYISENYRTREINNTYFRTEEACRNFIKKYKKFICRELGYKESEVIIDE